MPPSFLALTAMCVSSFCLRVVPALCYARIRVRARPLETQRPVLLSATDAALELNACARLDRLQELVTELSSLRL